ncbi:MAG: 4-alpha-glucanotransferase [Bacteroidetes bacterium GWE2_29_8]|nr:MAG: 4-alpha-glucanotransferase [Bacteroidetes bacterium GWE2_29_8]OFY19648.1 MAG: 4-alpha-glucanotransferase [Bacteroidetes bacterium GWF2_29_10]
MKVLMFGWEFPPHITGGLGTACYGLTRGLLKSGVEILFVVPKAYGDEDSRYVKMVSASDVEINIKEKLFQEYWKQITYLEVYSNIVPYLSPEEYDRIINKEEFAGSDSQESIFSKKYSFSGKYGSSLMSEVARYALTASKLATENEFDIIHAHDWLTYPAGIAAKSASGKPLIIHVHATEFDRSGENINQNVYEIEKKGMDAADKIITVSNYTRDIVIERYHINPDKVVTVHNAVDQIANIERLEYKRHLQEKIVTFLGRVTFQKGPDYFVEAANKIIQKDKNVRFVMAGSGDMLYRMIKRVAQLKIATHFHFTGFLQGDDVLKMYSLSDVYVMPSVSEPFGISPLEALMSNVPVIISKQSGVSEVLRHAIKVDFWDIDAMADAIYGILHYKALSDVFIKYGKIEVDNLKWEHVGFKVKGLYEEMLY